MSIPDRFYRIAKHKLGEMKDWFDKVDEEEDFEAELKRRRADSRNDAQRELKDTLAPSGNAGGGTRPASGSSSSNPSSIPMNTPRSPQEIARGARPAGSTPSYSNTTPSGNTGGGGTTNTPQVDPLDYHYKLLGLESGAEFAAVQSAYNKLAARCDPARFTAGSQEEQQARQIRQRLDASYKQLREVLDSTSTRFNLLEFDDLPKPPKDADNPDERKK